jgi:hypothetical protein
MASSITAALTLLIALAIASDVGAELDRSKSQSPVAASNELSRASLFVMITSTGLACLPSSIRIVHARADKPLLETFAEFFLG